MCGEPESNKHNNKFMLEKLKKTLHIKYLKSSALKSQNVFKSYLQNNKQTLK